MTDRVEFLALADDEDDARPSREGDPFLATRGSDDVEYVMERTDVVAADFLAPLPPDLLVVERVIVVDDDDNEEEEEDEEEAGRTGLAISAIGILTTVFSLSNLPSDSEGEAGEEATVWEIAGCCCCVCCC